MTFGFRHLLTAGAASAALLLCAFAPAPQSEAALSPDQYRLAIVQNSSTDADPDAGPASVLRIAPVGDQTGRVLLRGKPHAGQDPKRALHSFAHPMWSLDGGYIYVEASAWATSGAIHQVNVKTGAERYVIDGNGLQIVRTGPYRGMLLVSRHRYHPAPQLGSYDPVDLVRPDGKVILTVPGSETDEGKPRVERWLKSHGWEAS